MEHKKAIHEANAILRVEWIDFPISVADGILEEACDVLEGSPFLRVVSWLLHGVNEFAKVAIS